MNFRMIGIVAALPLLGSSFAVLGDSTMRCDRVLVRVGMIAGEVIAKCGEPRSKQIDEVPVRVKNRNGAVNVVGTTKVETWVYDRGYGQFPAELKFEEGKLKTIEYLTAR
jgi:hypothetical protein